ncbi:CCA tRNA nucleotidyltransferase [Candidatus Gracilibacteria bacterium]|nr:CCA tRNA nucleotidyltransferase [Candidatus Gracilibacteria bacterium]
MQSTSLQIIEILKKASHQAFWAGGCVRDMLLGIKPKDFDIVTSATPDQIEQLLEKTIPIGKQYGVILAIQNGHSFEIATFRSDSDSSDGRRPDAVTFTNPEQDAKRRDFTINALFYDPTTEEVLDFIDGQKDLRDKLVRFIGDPTTRIHEDHLRILRAVRFKNLYDFQYHPETYQAIKAHADLVTNISPERLREELTKMILDHTNPGQAFEELFEIGVLQHIIPELAQLKGLAQPLQYHQEGDVWDHSLRALNALTAEASLALKWATLLHDIGKFATFSQDAERIRYDHHAQIGADIAKQILTRLRFPRKIIKEVHFLIEHHMMTVPLLEMSDSARRRWFLKPEFEDLLELFRADAAGTIPGTLDQYEQIKKLYRHEIATLKLLPKTLLTGEEIMKTLNLKPGKQVGDILDQIREKQLAGEIKTVEEAREFLASLPS